MAFDCDCATWPDMTTLPYPAVYSLELTRTCTNQCTGCSNRFIAAFPQVLMEKTTPLAVAQWESILTTIAPFAQRLKLTGGEPTTHPDFAAIVQAVQHHALPFTLLTNGCWQHPEHIVTLLRDTPACAGLLVSLHGADAATHEAFTRVPGSFAQVVENIQRATRAGLRVQTNTVLNHHNHHQVAAVVQFVQSLGAVGAVFNRYVGMPALGMDIPPDTLQHALDEIARLDAAGHPARPGTCVPHCFSPAAPGGCAAGTAACTIDPWGYVRPCNHAPQVAGNVLTEPLETIWHSPAMDNWRTLIPSSCRACPALEQCHGGCRADAVLRRCACDTLIPRAALP